MKEATEWIRVVCFGRKAEIAGEYLTSGSSVYVSRRARTREYEKRRQKRYATEFVADKLILLGRGRVAVRQGRGPGRGVCGQARWRFSPIWPTTFRFDGGEHGPL